MKSTRQKEYAESFKRASLDPEIKNMAEEGLEDYLKQLSCQKKRITKKRSPAL